MKNLKESIHKALRDDSVATVGLRALLVGTVTPYNVYFGHWQEIPDFTSKHYLTWYFLPMKANDVPGNDARLREQPFSVTAWSKDADKVEDVHKRVRWILDNLNQRALTIPTADAQLHMIRLEGGGPDLFDDEFKVYYRAEQYRAWYREDVAW